MSQTDSTKSSLPSGLPDWIHNHLKLYREDPEKAHLWDASNAGGAGKVTTLLLTTTGRKSGEARTTPLIYQQYGDAYVIMGSKAGKPTHPLWYMNLEADPNCHIQVVHDHFDAVARVAEGEEREKLWSLMSAAYPLYNDYQKEAGERLIPVVVLEPK